MFRSIVKYLLPFPRNLSQRLFPFVRTQSARLLSKAFTIFKVCNRSFKFDCSGSKTATGTSFYVSEDCTVSTLGATLRIIAIVTKSFIKNRLQDRFRGNINNREIFRSEPLVPRVSLSSPFKHNKLPQETQLPGGTSKSGTGFIGPRSPFLLHSLRQLYPLNISNQYKKSSDAESQTSKGK